MTTSDPERTPERVELEAKLTFLERTVEVMSKVMQEQGEQIERVDQQLAALMARLEEGADGADNPFPHDDPPPHY